MTVQLIAALFPGDPDTIEGSKPIDLCALRLGNLNELEQALASLKTFLSSLVTMVTECEKRGERAKA